MLAVDQMHAKQLLPSKRHLGQVRAGYKMALGEILSSFTNHHAAAKTNDITSLRPPSPSNNTNICSHLDVTRSEDTDRGDLDLVNTIKSERQELDLGCEIRGRVYFQARVPSCASVHPTNTITAIAQFRGHQDIQESAAKVRIARGKFRGPVCASRPGEYEQKQARPRSPGVTKSHVEGVQALERVFVV